MDPREVRGSRWRRLFVGAVTFGLVAAGAFAGCGLPTSGTQPQNCTVDGECDDQNPCTVDHCSPDGICVHTGDDNAVVAQVVGDCQRASCQGGFLVHAEDPKDTANDGESCTTDSCMQGKPIHTPLGDGQGCAVAANAGSCKGGKCQVQCTAADAATKCDDAKPCTKDSCNLTSGVCEHEALDGIPTPDDQQTAGDCKLNMCQNGEVAKVQDNTDVPVDGNPCTDDVCKFGDPSNPPTVAGAKCSDGGDPLASVCDGAGTCRQCNQPVDCTKKPVNAKPDDDCHTLTCKAGVCGQDNTAVNTPINATLQNKGDCKVIVCDGAGKTKVNTDTMDLPVDNNGCTKDVCTGNSPSNPPEALNFACGAMSKLFCDGAGTCVGCNADNQCPLDTFCQDNFCDNATKSCKVNNTANGAVLPNGQQAAGDCQQLQCNGNGGTKSVADNNDLPADDGKQCTSETCSNGMPQHPPKATNTVCNQGGGFFCDNAGNCVECNMATQCTVPPECQHATCTMNKCGKANDAQGVQAATQTSGDCKKKVCDGMGAVDPMPVVDDTDIPIDGIICTKDQCSNGTPSNPPQASGSQFAGTCDNANGCGNKPCACDGAGTCKSNPGATCANGTTCVSTFCADSVCCKTACGGACDKCDAAGNCQAAAVKNMTDPNACDAANGTCNKKPCTCDNAGACKDALGVADVAGNCASGIAADGVCCDTTCAGACSACTVALGAAKDGTCAANAVKSADDAGACDAANGACNKKPCTCSGTGVCKDALGVADTAANCASGIAADGVCCDTTCSAGCSACTMALGASKDGTCTAAAIKSADDAGACDAANGSCNKKPCTCSAAGACKDALGVMDTAGNCASGNAADGLCCNTSCTGACSACSVANGAAMDGTCLANAVKSKQDAGACDDTNGMCFMTDKCSCSGGGVCLRKNGEGCSMNGQCASNFCVDGVCCNSACNAECSACSVAAGATTDGTCKANAVKSAIDSGTCDATNGSCTGGILCICNAAGVCLGDTGAMCTTDAECASVQGCNTGLGTCK